MSPRKSESPPTGPLQMSDIARMAGVSESTVSRALANNPAVAAR
ncbi:MAG: LacI family transcriptional regulator, partial [Gammaproteobacteria bacterium HGW-Gammaproteobacteria-5]